MLNTLVDWCMTHRAELFAALMAELIIIWLICRMWDWRKEEVIDYDALQRQQFQGKPVWRVRPQRREVDMSTVHTMPNKAGSLQEVVVVPVTSVSAAFPQGRRMYIAYVKDSIFERPVFTSRECFTMYGAVEQCAKWAENNGYLPSR